MPELKHTFTGGKMDKDNDERIVANGQYREALNIEVATSEGSNVGAAQNILGNLKQTVAVSGPNNKYLDYNHHVAHVVDPLTDNVYRFVHTPAAPLGIWMDRIVEFNTQGMGDSNGRVFDPFYNEKAVVVDIYKVRTVLTGVHTTPCDHEVYLDFTSNAFQIRWGMQLTSIPSLFGYENLQKWGVYIESVEVLDDGTGNTPASVRCKMNVNESDFEVDPTTGLRIPLRESITNLVGQQMILESDRNLNFEPLVNRSDFGINGVNIIDGMIFWTDNWSEPKKINIERAKAGSTWQSWDHWRDRRLLDVASGFDYGDFDQQTRLVIKGENPTDCVINNSSCGPPAPPPGPGSKIYGCTDPAADNYDSSANSDDGSCRYSAGEVCGCTISEYKIGFAHDHTGHFVHSGLVPINYNPNATVDDGSCLCMFEGNGGTGGMPAGPNQWGSTTIGPNLVGDWHWGTVNCYDSSNTVYQAYQTSGQTAARNEMDVLDPNNIKSFQQEGYTIGGDASYQFDEDGWLVDSTPVGPIATSNNGCGGESPLTWKDEFQLPSPFKYNGDDEPEASYSPGPTPPSSGTGPSQGISSGPSQGISSGPVSPAVSTRNNPQAPVPQSWTGEGPALGDPVSGVTLNDYEDPVTIPVRGGWETNRTVFTYSCRPVYMEEKHMTVIRKGPTTPPTVEMYSTTQPDFNNDGFVDVEGVMRGITSTIVGNEANEFIDDGFGNLTINPNYNADYPNGYNLTGVSKALYTDGQPGRLNKNISIFYDDDGLLLQAGSEVTLNIDVGGSGEDWKLNDKLTIAGQYYNSFGVKKGCGATGVIINMSSPSSTPQNGVRIRLTSISPSTPMQVGPNDIYTVSLKQKEPMFEYKFPRFAYRYKYEDGEFSIFSPWSEVAFVPDEFDYLPKKGYNLGMTNRVRSLEVVNFVPKNIPKDVVQVDLLYKESNSPNIYTVESFKPEDPLPDAGAVYNYWNSPGTGKNKGRYRVTSELIHAVVPSNQLLRPWDNVPRMAQAQEITANRLIYANYVQNYDTVDESGAPIKPIFSINVDSIDVTDTLTGGSLDDPSIGRPSKSLKTMRTYQLGVVYRDRYGRETPVLTSESGSIQIPKSESFKFNRLNVSLNNTANGESNYPEWAESYTFYVKETSNEYYNVSMDRWYNADDGNVWLSFPSSERNKINDDTVLILKKQHDNNIPVTEETRYKVVSIKSDAPKFIKTENQYWGSLTMMLPPPGWGGGGKPGGWQSGMFSPSGLPLPNHQYLDIYAEYWDQSVFSELNKQPTFQIRLVQAPGQASDYNPATGAGSVSPTTNFSKWYDVASISHVGQPPEVKEEEVHTYDSQGNLTGSTTQQVEQPATEIQLVRLTLEKVMGPEVSFAKAADLLDLSRGLILEARTQIIKDKSQFQGRFFVKVERDAVIENSIIAPQTKNADNWQVLQSREISYLCAAHPGRQDWNHNVYVPVAGEGSYPVTWSGTDQGNTSIQGFGFEGSPIPSGVSNNASGVRLISSYHKHAGRNAPAYAMNGVLINPPIHPQSDDVFFKELSGSTWVQGNGTKYSWPYGPGEQEEEVWLNQPPSAGVAGGSWSPPISGGGWLSGAIAASIGVKGQITTIAGHAPASGSTWPSYGNGVAEGGAWLPSYGDHSVTGVAFAFGQYDNTLTSEYPVDNSRLIEPAAGWDGVNHFWKPAIWDRGDTVHGGDPYNWSKDTIWSLAGAWYDFAAGRKINSTWPLTTSWKRWFIDKAGAARGYSGAGIWNDGNVSKMDLSFFGIGKHTDTGFRGFELAQYQPEELTFAEAIGTVGTSFRFAQDPDQTVYTITDVKIQNVYNFEAPCGTWGYIDGIKKPMITNDAGTPNDTSDDFEELQFPNENGGYGPNDGSHPEMADRGSGCAKSLWPNAIIAKKNAKYGWAGKEAFMSDFLMGVQDMAWGTQTYHCGGSPFNRRVRFTLTLDKIIGNGPNNFHPITNHVGPRDSNGNQEANIIHAINELAAPEYSVGSTASGHGSSTVQNGGTPEGKFFYNLNSYWNAADGAGGGVNSQDPIYNPSSGYYATNPNAYIGLHERGLNHTTIEIIAPYSGDEGDRPMSNNPAVWETEPKEDVGLDIYQAASQTYPINLQRHRKNIDNYINYDYGDRGEEYIPIGATCEIMGGSGLTAQVDGIKGNLIFLNSHVYESAPGVAGEVPLTDTNGDPTKFIFRWKGEGFYYGAFEDEMFVEATIQRTFSNNILAIEINPDIHNERKSLSYFNCYSFANGIESNRIRDDYNAVTIDKGVKASMPLAEQYEEERKASSLIFSGIYNSTSGINRTNQFIQAEPITKDLNPINGSIQKLYTRDTDLVTFCENKVFKILAKKDALFNADGKAALTSNAAVLGQAIPFSGEYGIGKNPESFAAESFRMYFADKTRGAVLRLSRDGLTNISDYGMKDWFKDRLKFADRIAGSFDDRKDEYNLTIETYNSPEPEFVTLQGQTMGNDRSLAGMSAYTVSFTESRKGWVSFKSFIHEDGFSYKNDYYTFPSNVFNRTKDIQLKSPLGFNYGNEHGNSELWKHHQDIKMRALINFDVNNFDTLELTLKDSTQIASDYVIIKGMIVSGNGIPLETKVTSVNYTNANTVTITISNKVHVFANEEIILTSARNNFYNIDSFSSVTVMFNGDQGSVKRFKTINYEGTQAETTFKENNVQYLYDSNLSADTSGVAVGEIYYDNYPKDGWKVESLKTDMQEGTITEFIGKENKWFNYIRGFKDAGEGDLIDIGEFSSQGLGRYDTIQPTQDIQGCLDPTAINFAGQGNTNGVNPPANLPCYGCCLYNQGCLDPNATNFDPSADSACSGCCVYTSGCTDPLAFNYDPSAYNDDGSCIYCVDGCTDENASNYDPAATCNDGSCLYVWGCTDDVTIDGCGIGCDGAMNFDASATADDGSCVYCLYGCMDALANNYDANATCDDGNCDMCVHGCTANGTHGNGPNGDGSDVQTNPTGQNFYDPFNGNVADNYDSSATCDDGSCILAGCTNFNSDNFCPECNQDDGSCFSCNCTGGQCCTDPLAFNYNPSATCDCNGEEIGHLDYVQNAGWDDCCIPIIKGCTNPAAANYLNTAGDGGRDCGGGDLSTGVYPNVPCDTDVYPPVSGGSNARDNWGCDMPDVTPDTYIRVIQDISASMSYITTPLKNAVVGDYGTPNCLRTDLQDIYANHPTWTQQVCIDNHNNNIGSSGCFAANNCQHQSCDPALNGADAYEAHVSWVAGWEYGVAWAGNLSPIHNHGTSVHQGGQCNDCDGHANSLVGGFFGPSATLNNGKPIWVNKVTQQADIKDLRDGTSWASAINNNGIDVLTRQQAMDEGLTTFPAPIEKVYMISITDENAYHYQGTGTTVIDMVKKGCTYDLGDPTLDGSAGPGTFNGWPKITTDLSVPAGGTYGSTFNYTRNNPNGLTVNGHTFPQGCGDLRQLGPPDWDGPPTSPTFDDYGPGVGNFASSSSRELNTIKHEGALLKDIGALQQQLSAVVTNGNIKYGAALMTINAQPSTEDPPDYALAVTQGLKQMYHCIVEGDDGVNGCWAFGDFAGTDFDHSLEGYVNVRNVASYDGMSINGGAGSINFVVPDTINYGLGTAQADMYTAIKGAFNQLGVNI